MTRLEIRGLTVSFGATPVLKGVDLCVPSGLTAVLGASGDGKTTLLRCVAGFLRPDAGSIRLGERLVAGEGTFVAPRERRIGYVPQEGALFPHLDVAGNITFGLPRHERGGARLREMLDLVELPSSIASRSAHELSGGQQQRVALARALAPKPAVVLLDEPFSSLDASLREGTGRAVVRALQAERTTAVLVTHDQDEAMSLADQIAVMRQGQLVQVASPREMYDAPADPEVARFVGGATVLPGVAKGRRAECALGEVRLADEAAVSVGLVVVRPEQVVVGPEGVAAHVVDVSYYGHDANVRLLLEDGVTTVLSRISSADVPQPGDLVRLRVEGAVRVFAG